jgi:hypothetical protein
MAQLGGSIISIDCTVKIANRIYVYIDGTHFKPWAGMTAIRNEFNQIIWWGMVTVVDSYSEIKPHLIALKERLDKIQGPDELKVIYVDNCCSVRKILQDIFGAHVLIKLDVFHWLKRWNDILLDPSAKEAWVFKMNMS